LRNWNQNAFWMRTQHEMELRKSKKSENPKMR
jgi:hypothetical protein